jgi:RNA polymerase sigma-70 factor, ECF subfamily
MEAAQAKAGAREHSVYERIERETTHVSQAVNARSDSVIPLVIRAWPEPTKSVDFDSAVLTHLNAAYNLARWLVRDEHDAEDIVQEAYLRALRFFAGFRGDDPRAWLLKIVRNTAFTWLKRNRPADPPVEFDENIHLASADAPTLEASLLRKADSAMIRAALDELPAEFREVVVLRDFEELSYKEIGDIAEIPVGTVMSRLARARTKLARSITVRVKEA